MKQKTLYGIVTLLVCIVALILSFNYNLRENISRLEEIVAVSKLEVTDINNQLSINESVIDKEYNALNAEIKAYEKIIIKWFEFDIHNIFQPQLILKSYDLKAVVQTSEGSFDLPPNGYIETDSDFVAIEITVVEPPVVENIQINGWLHYYDNVFDDIEDQDIENYTVEDQTLIIRYDTLINGDQVSVPLSNLLSDLLNLDDNLITINITDTFEKASDYMPKDVKTKTFGSDMDKQNFTHTFEYLSDDEWIINYRYGGVGDTISRDVFNGAYEIKYENKGYIGANEGSWNGEVFDPIDSVEKIILPEYIKLGESWQADTREATITAIDYVVQTTFGEFETIEITYRYPRGLSDLVCYYAKNIKTDHFKMISLYYIK